MNKSDIELIKATHEYAEQVWQFRQEILDCDSNSESQFAGCLSLDEATSAEKWIRWCQLRNMFLQLPTLLYAKAIITWSGLLICATISITLSSELGAVIVVILFALPNEDTVTQRKCFDRISVTQKSLVLRNYWLPVIQIMLQARER